MDRILQYKINKAIAAGNNGADAIAKHLQGIYTVKTVQRQLDIMFPEDIEEDILEREATIDELAKYVIDVAKHREKAPGEILANWDYCPSACACIGPQDGEPLCPCGMREAINTNKREILEHLYMEAVIANVD